MKPKWKALAADLLKKAADQFANHGCNDYKLPEHWSPLEIEELARAYHEWNGDPKEWDVDNSRTQSDFSLMSFLGAMLLEETK